MAHQLKVPAAKTDDLSVASGCVSTFMLFITSYNHPTYVNLHWTKA